MLAVANAEKAGGLLECLWPESGDLEQFLARLEGPFSSRCATMFAATREFSPET
jgi:hypothetical protein